ncbi:peptidase C39 family protein [Nocardioides sp. 616]|uniref:peptidase C39 family protein n=1 Tax=Nocardioides sp. 616 TaxID=2268090 RepID=UPI000CE4DC6B|nr:peptidase C39 family protein [Nocardioides sp. 616]
MPPLPRRSRHVPLLAAAVAVTLCAALPVPAGADEPAPSARRNLTFVAHTSFDTAVQLRSGTRSATKVAKGSVRLKSPKNTRAFSGRRYHVGTWTSPWVTESSDLSELIPSWQASTPGDSWIEVRARVRSAAQTVGSWDTMARWSSTDRWIKRSSLSGQDDDLARVNADTLQVPAGATGWQLRVKLMRRTGSKAQPSLDRVGAMASRVLPRTAGTPASKAGVAAGTVLDVPAYSQMTHRGHYPQWGNGGEAWCSPTSTAMVLQYYGVNPAAGQAFTPAGHADGIVDWTAQQVYDHGYRGTGNWAFNTAYAGTLLRSSHVTRLPDLAAAEPHILAGTPLIVSVAFGRGQLTGAPISATAGHLMVLVGFTPEGDVVVNDPAAPTNASVRRTYDRAQFENAWLGGSGGITYVLED